MKRCPECGRNYNDDSLSFCLDDGSELLFGPSSIDEPATAILTSSRPVATTFPVNDSRERAHVSVRRTAGALWPNYFWLMAGLFIVVAGGLYFVYRVTSNSSRGLQHFQSIKLARITTEGAVESAAISHDGKFVAYTLEESGKRSLWTKNLASDSRVQIVSPVEAPSMFAGTFSPDGSYVYYTRVDDQNPRGALYIVPVLGGDSKKTASDVSQPVSISPDGKQIAYGRYHLKGPEDELYIAGADGSGESLILTVKEPDFLMGSNLAWSPDAKSLAFGYGALIKGTDPADHRYDMRVAIFSLADKRLQIVSNDGSPHVGNLSWLNDGSAVAFVASDDSLNTNQIWQCSIESGESRQITNDLSSYDMLSLSATSDSRMLIAVQTDPVSQIWVAPTGDASRARSISTRKNVQDARGNLAWTPDGKLIFDSTANASVGIWIMNADGTDAKLLTGATNSAFAPEVSPDGNGIFFGSVKNGSFQIWRVGTDGRDPRQITNGEGAPTYSISPDGKWLIYNPYLGGIYKMPADGGEAVRIVSGGGLVYPQVSPDGKLLAYFTTSDETRRPQIVVVNFADGSLVRSFEVPVSGAPPLIDSLRYRGFHWSPDGGGLVYINTLGGVSNLWRQPLDGGPAKQITDFKSDKIYTFAYSRDGKMLAFARGSNSSDVVLITDSK